MRFADLRERGGPDDPGRLDYHLNELTTHFVRRTEDGYELRESGKRIVRMLVSHVCDVCTYSWKLPTLLYPTRHPAVTALYYEHGIEFDLATYEQRAHLITYREELLADDPVRIRITIPLEDEDPRITFDEQMSVVGVSG